MATVHSPLAAWLGRSQLISVLFLCLLVAPVYAQSGRDEVIALQEFAPHLENTVGYWNVWNFSDQNACGWVGVICTANSTVAELHLSGWKLGFNDISLGALSSLRDLHLLDLSSNHLFPNHLVGIGNLTRLTWLDLSQNQYLVGQIPANIFACKRLRYLSLSQNGFDSAIPSTLSDLKDLQFLLLAYNQLSGPFPTELTELSSLISIDLSHNSFNGSILALPNLPQLVSLQLDNNEFTKFEGSWFSTISQSLQVLSVSFNQVEDVLPSNITMRDLQIFNMSGNRLSGPIPSFTHALGTSPLDDTTSQSQFSNNFAKFSVDLSQNLLTGGIPSDLFHTNSYCYYLNLSYNHLSGNLPSKAGNISLDLMDCYSKLDLSHNNLSGLLPVNFIRSSRIFSLWLGNNNLSGDIVDDLSGSTGNIYELRLQNNLFTGDLSKLVDIHAFLSYLQVFDLSNNQLQWSVSDGMPDPITTTLEKLTGEAPLREFRVGGNNFSGTFLPIACFNNKSSRGFIANQILVFGGEPIGFDALQVLDLSSTHLKGEISSTAFNSTCLTSLQSLNLSNNAISGSIPDSIVRLPSLQILNMSNNHLTGQLPLFLLNSASLNNPRSYEGNEGLCGYPLPPCSQDMRGKGIPWWAVFIIIIGCGVIAIGSCLVATWRWLVYHKRHQQDADLIKTLFERESTTLMPLRELKKATDNFSKSAQVGEGGFGTVYVGKLNNGTMVAIKRSKREGSVKDKEQFLNEVRILSQVNHRNLVKLLGCCMENKIAVLVFEYIPNGTLQQHLSGKLGTVRLTWKQRLNIAIQTADALSYLHSTAVFPIYHRDVKPANILLDHNFNAKVGDFGISKLAPLQTDHVSTIAIQGTIGYIDPEYYTSYQLTDKSDVYSFGVVLLEIISAKAVLDFGRDGDKTSLVYFASSYIEGGDLHGLIDPALTKTYNDIVGGGRKSILAFSKLAMKCVDIQAKARPSMSEVLKELQNIWAELQGTCKHLDYSISEDHIEDLRRGHRFLLSSFYSKDSSSFALQTDCRSVQMSELSGPVSFTSTSMG